MKIPKWKVLPPSGSLGLAVLAVPWSAGAQTPAAPTPATPAAATPTVQAGGGSVVYVPPPGFAQPGADPNAYLPSSAKPLSDVSRSTDTFDLNKPSTGDPVLRGGPNAAFITGARALNVPNYHLVRRGDTLWDVTGHYYSNPWQWPKVWSYNAQIQNPHWIYPGDRVRLRPGADVSGVAPSGAQTLGSGLVNRRPIVPANTIFLRDVGYIDDEPKDVWGDVSGSPDDQVLLSEGNDVYVSVARGHELRPGQQLTMFRPVRDVASGELKGTLVAIMGTVRVDEYDAQNRLARGQIIESLDVIERGVKVGPVTRRFDVVPPVKNETEVSARIVATVYPHAFFGQNQVVFIDHGEKDGLVPGNRLFVVEKGDAWRRTLTSGSQFASAAVRYEGDKPAAIDEKGARGRADDPRYPEEVVAELRVLAVRDHSATCLVISSLHELERGARAVARRGY